MARKRGDRKHGSFLACVADIERRAIGAFGLIVILRQSFDISHRSDSKKGS